MKAGWKKDRLAISPANLVPLTSRRAKPNFSFYYLSTPRTILKQPQATLAEDASLRLSHAACSNFETSNLAATSGGKNTRSLNRSQDRHQSFISPSFLFWICHVKGARASRRLYQLGVKLQMATMMAVIKVRALSCQPCDSHVPREALHLCVEYATLLPVQRGRRSALRCAQIMQPCGTVQIQKSSGWTSSSASSAR